MLTGPSALRASEILSTRIPPEHVSEIVTAVIQNPTNENLNLLGILFPFTGEELRQIQRLRDHEIHNGPLNTKLPSEKASSSMPYWEEMKQLWQDLVDAKEYVSRDIRDYLESCLAICGAGSDPWCYPGVPVAIGFGYRLARLNLGLTHNDVRERLEISLNMLRNLEWGNDAVLLHEKISPYLTMLFPSGGHREKQALQLILSSPECCMAFFEHVKRLPHFGVPAPTWDGLN